MKIYEVLFTYYDSKFVPNKRRAEALVKECDDAYTIIEHTLPERIDKELICKIASGTGYTIKSEAIWERWRKP